MTLGDEKIHWCWRWNPLSWSFGRWEWERCGVRMWITAIGPLSIWRVWIETPAADLPREKR